MARSIARANVCDPDRMNMQRIAANVLVVSGGAFWAVAAFSGDYVFHQSQLAPAIGTALVPLAFTIVVFGIGALSERMAAVLLFAVSVIGMAWGAVQGWDAILWALVVAFLVVPQVAAGTLYLLAARMEAACGGAKRAVALLGAPEGDALT